MNKNYFNSVLNGLLTLEYYWREVLQICKKEKYTVVNTKAIGTFLSCVLLFLQGN